MSHWETSDESTLSAYLERIGAPQCAPLPRRVEEQFARWWKQSGNTTLERRLISYGTSAQRDVEAELNGEATESAINEQLGKKFGASPTKVQLARARLVARGKS